MRIADLLAIALLLTPDFSGRWVLVAPANAGPDVPTAITVEQTVTEKNVYGEPMTPFVSDMRVTREFADGPKTSTYKVGASGGVVGGSVGSGVEVTSSEYAVIWRGETLVITERIQRRPAWDRTTVSSREELWSLVGDRLVVRITEQTGDAPPRTIEMTFRRE